MNWSTRQKVPLWIHLPTLGRWKVSVSMPSEGSTVWFHALAISHRAIAAAAPPARAHDTGPPLGAHGRTRSPPPRSRARGPPGDGRRRSAAAPGVPRVGPERRRDGGTAISAAVPRPPRAVSARASGGPQPPSGCARGPSATPAFPSPPGRAAREDPERPRDQVDRDQRRGCPGATPASAPASGGSPSPRRSPRRPAPGRPSRRRKRAR